MLRFWKRSLLRGFIRYQKSEDRPSPVLADHVLEAARDCFSRIGLCSVWAWDGGSRPFFWNWKEEVHEDLIRGMTMWIREPIVPWTWKQPAPVPQHPQQQVLEKLDVICLRGYVGEGQVESLICFFAVQKGASDIRMVYDGTQSGLNDVLWAPWFPLPTVNSHLRLVEPGTFMADNDVGECFHNWMLDKRVRKWCGIDLTSTLKLRERVWSRWNCCAMGLRPSPYVSVRGVLWLKEEAQGQASDQDSGFRWERVELNLPGDPAYSPVRPWVSKRQKDGTLADDLVSFVDDIRPTGPTEKKARQASQVMAKESAYRGIQDAARKRRDISQTPGAWAESVVHTTDSSVTIMLEQTKWDKTKVRLQWVSCQLEEGPDVEHKPRPRLPELRYAGVPDDDSVSARISWNIGLVAFKPYR